MREYTLPETNIAPENPALLASRAEQIQGSGKCYDLQE